MIGLGKWEADINMLIYRGTIGIDIADDNGNYKVDFILPEKLSKLKITTKDIVAEGNKLSGKGEVDMGKGRVIEAFAEAIIDGDTLTGSLKIPMLKRDIPLKNGHRVG